MAYTNFTNCTEEEYLSIIYGQDDKNRIRIWFNNVELEDAGQYCISLNGTNRIFPDDGSKRFSLGNFVAKEYELVLRDLPDSTVIADQVRISIGTLVGENTYEDVPIGIFNIQDTPETDRNQITIKLRDNRVKFDFGYDASGLISTQGGSATYKQILNDICTKAGVTNDVTTFNGENIAVSIYDNTITGSTYVAYIAEQAGAVPIITRAGHLDFIYLNDLKTWRIPLSIVEKYEIGKPFEVERAVYESGIIKYETSQDETLETLYLDAANPYISSQAQVDNVFDIMEDFTIDSAATGRVLGNPAIDPYDLIEIYDDSEEPPTPPTPTADYQEVEYIQSSGTQYIDTGVKPNGTTKVEIKFQRIRKYGSYDKLFGSEIDHNNQSYKLDIRDPFIFNYYNQEYTTQYRTWNNNIYEVSFEKGKVTVNNSDYIYTTGNTVSNNYNIYLCAGNRNNEALEFSAVKIFSCKIYDDGVMVRDFMPCYRISDNEIGLLDKVNNVFYPNAGTGDFTKGNDVNSNTESLSTTSSESTQTTILKTLANNTYTFNGVHRNNFDTTIGEEERKENVSIRSEATNRRWAKTEIDNLNATVTITAGKVEQLEQSIEVLSADLDTNVIVIPVDSGNVPFTSKTYEIGYSVKYLGSPLSTGYTITTSDTHTGITTDLTTLGKLKFTVSNSTAISSVDNKYTFSISYTTGGDTFTVTRSVVISLISSDSEQNVVISDTAPSDTDLLWLDSTTDELKRYIDGNWLLVNDFSSDISSINANISSLNGTIQDNYNTLNGAINTLSQNVSTQFQQTADSFNASISRISDDIADKDTATNTRIDDIQSYLSYALEEVYNPITSSTSTTGVVTIGKSNNTIKLKQANDILFFEVNGVNVGYLGTDSAGNSKIYFVDAQIVNSIRLGNFEFIPRANGSLSFRKVS